MKTVKIAKYKKTSDNPEYDTVSVDDNLSNWRQQEQIQDSLSSDYWAYREIK